LLASWLSAGVATAARASAAARAAADAEPTFELLRRRGANRDELIAAFIALGPDAIEPAIDALRDESVPSSAGETPAPLPRETLDAVREALFHLDRATVVASLRMRTARSAESGDRRVVLELLGGLGSAQDLELFVDTATPPSVGTGFDSRVAAVAQRSLEQLFQREPAAIELAAKRLSASHEDVAPLIARAIVASGSPASFDLLALSVGQRPGLDLIVIPCIPAAQGRATSPQRNRVLESVRNDLASSNPMLARAAAMACGEFADPLAAPSLCRLLGDSDAELASAAHVSLKRLSGLGLAAQPARWQQWLAAEEAWFQAEAGLALEQLESSSEQEVLQALQSLVLHPLYRENLAASVAAVARRGAPGVRKLACTVLGRWRSPSSIPVLRELVRDRRADVAAAARDALAAIESRPARSR
jgi:HEAT repeat protein